MDAVSPLKILIADDNKSDRMILSAIVKKMGLEVCEAADGLEAIEQFKTQLPDIILLDVIMPNMDGQEAALEIKSLAGEDMIPIIFLTSLQDAHDLAKCLDSGGDDFLTKPIIRLYYKRKLMLLAACGACTIRYSANEMSYAITMNTWCTSKKWPRRFMTTSPTRAAYIFLI